MLLWGTRKQHVPPRKERTEQFVPSAINQGDRISTTDLVINRSLNLLSLYRISLSPILGMVLISFFFWNTILMKLDGHNGLMRKSGCEFPRCLKCTGSFANSLANLRHLGSTMASFTHFRLFESAIPAQPLPSSYYYPRVKVSVF